MHNAIFYGEYLIKLFNSDVNYCSVEVFNNHTLEAFGIRLFVDREDLIKLFNRDSRGESLRSTDPPLGIGNFRNSAQKY